MALSLSHYTSLSVTSFVVCLIVFSVYANKSHYFDNNTADHPGGTVAFVCSLLSSLTCVVSCLFLVASADKYKIAHRS